MIRPTASGGRSAIVLLRRVAQKPVLAVINSQNAFQHPVEVLTSWGQWLVTDHCYCSRSPVRPRGSVTWSVNSRNTGFWRRRESGPHRSTMAARYWRRCSRSSSSGEGPPVLGLRFLSLATSGLSVPTRVGRDSGAVLPAHRSDRRSRGLVAAPWVATHRPGFFSLGYFVIGVRELEAHEDLAERPSVLA